MTTTQLAVATRKGLWFFRSTDRRTWSVDGPHHFGAMVHHVVLDPRDGRTMLAATRTGHLGPALMRTVDHGKTWTQITTPPAFPKGEPRGRAVDHVFWLTPGHASELAAEAITDGEEVVVAVGGDGTICEVLQGLHGAGRPAALGNSSISPSSGTSSLANMNEPVA